MTAIGELVSSFGMWRIWGRLGLRDLRQRYRRSRIGPSWVFINLAVTLIVVGIIYGTLLKQSYRDFLPYLAAGLVAWTFLTSAVVDGGAAFIVAEGYIKQIGLPIYVHVLRAAVANSLIGALGLWAYVVVALVFGVHFHVGIIWVVVGIVLLEALALPVMIISAHIGTRYRDWVPFAGTVMGVMFYATPVIWPAKLLEKTNYGWIVRVNPLFHALEVVRQPLLASRPASLQDYASVIGSTLLATVVALIVVARRHSMVAYDL